uniref:Uncharacterized protein n=1 Tax=Nelumbo nucifera TaxID=4432 RepID=A0A822YEV3_NELNU|nr:TPA_asm: hypothetical protein HUJ06_029516 [Nelumbo nucifera]
MFLLIVLLFCFMILTFVVTNKSAREVLSCKGYKEYKLGDYSNWLQKRVNNNKNCNKIKSCLMNSYVCNSLSDATDTVEQFYARHWSSIRNPFHLYQLFSFSLSTLGILILKLFGRSPPIFWISYLYLLV